MRKFIRIAVVGVFFAGVAAGSCVKNPVTPESPDPEDEEPEDTSHLNISERPPEGASLPTVRFIVPE